MSACILDTIYTTQEPIRSFCLCNDIKTTMKIRMNTIDRMEIDKILANVKHEQIMYFFGRITLDI